MCGVLFINSKKNILDKKLCLDAFKTLKSRGPDKQLHEFIDKKNFLGNSILSITGKVKNGRSLYGNKNFKLSFNGEIYNYKFLQSKYHFKSSQIKSDTDLLLKINMQKGPVKAAKKLDGMYAYAFFDRKKDKISFVTDPQGEKKLFIYNDKDYFIVSSTILAVKKFINLKNIDYNVLNDYFATRHFLFKERTIYKNLSISKLGEVLNYNIKTKQFNHKRYFDIFNLISEKKYDYFRKFPLSEIADKFERLLHKRLLSMLPNRKFASIFSGGVDSSLISVLLSKIKIPNLLACLDHKGKDQTIKKTRVMSKLFNGKLATRNINSKKYFSTLNKAYSLICHPFCTHDFVGRLQISELFKKKNCKVYFVADGADELFGGYEKYKKKIWKQRKNCSPYSEFKKGINNNSELKRYIDKVWEKAFLKYTKFLDTRESSIQASLFTDYFIQCVSVGNIGTDLMSGENSVEPRTPFIQKDIIEFAINLPLKFKINFKTKNKKLATKPVLKMIFLKYFKKEFLFKKQGFPGFPNETFKHMNINDKKKIKKIFGIMSKSRKVDREFKWKVLNIYFFAKYNNIFIDFKKLK